MPSLLASDIQRGPKQFLVSGFEPADAFMHRLTRRSAEQESAWRKGPKVIEFLGGRCRVRTCDPCRVKAVLYR